MYTLNTVSPAKVMLPGGAISFLNERPDKVFKCLLADIKYESSETPALTITAENKKICMTFAGCLENYQYTLDDNFADKNTQDLFNKHYGHITVALDNLKEAITLTLRATQTFTATFDEDMWNYLKDNPFTDKSGHLWEAVETDHIKKVQRSNGMVYQINVPNTITLSGNGVQICENFDTFQKEYNKYMLLKEFEKLCEKHNVPLAAKLKNLFK